MRVPDRWQTSANLGQTVILDKFLAFKTPLDAKFDAELREQERFQVSDLFRAAQQKFPALRIALVVDLSKSLAFYEARQLQQQNCQYLKISCDGFNEPPTLQQVQQFCDSCSAFFATRHERSAIVGVHCTHGFNRTGFMIVSYLHLVEKLSLEASFGLFRHARFPGIRKQHYIVELQTRYRSHALQNFLEQQNCAAADQSIALASGCSRKAADVKQFLGIKSLEDAKLIFEIQLQICQLMNLNFTPRFPGSQPVNLDHTNLANLRSLKYKVSWKADGTRILIFIKNRQNIFAVDRDFTIFPLGGKISFFSKDNPDIHLEDTLIDGELVIDKISSSSNAQEQEDVPRFLAYDLIRLAGKYVGDTCYENRLLLLQNEVETPRRKLIFEEKIKRKDEVFGFRLKPFYDIWHAAQLLSEKFSKSIAHESDGLIFQCNNQTYQNFTNPLLFKWKPSKQQTIDFKLEIRLLSGVGKVPSRKALLLVCLSGLNKLQVFGELRFQKELQELNGRIVECCYDVPNRLWSVVRVRNDKSMPNHISVAESVMRSIMNPLDEQFLLDFISHIN